MIGLVELILILALVGFMVWVIITYVPMPPLFKNLIVVVIVVVVVLYLIRMLSGGGSLHGL
jgi:hypothetical protein